MAGLSALCFLEEVDQQIGKDHLFKRSLILIKAWCYYESRILGAYYGLISTYALEVMILYIINRFHSSLHGPLTVLYRFLKYYSAFDWDTYCVTINGPVAISSLPEISETSEIDGEELLLNKDFMRNCKELYAGPTMALETSGLEFPIKHLNIVDPLKDNNNLGRSVNRASFHRIKYAFSYAAGKLEEILILPEESMIGKLKYFFRDTLDRKGIEQCSDVRAPVPVMVADRSEVFSLHGDNDSNYSGLQYGRWFHGCILPFPIQPSPPSSPSQMQNSTLPFPIQPSPPSSPSHIQNSTLPFPIQPSPPSSPSQIQNQNAWNIMDRFVQSNWNTFVQKSTMAFVPRQPFYHPNASPLSVAAFGVEPTAMSRGTGPYIPDINVIEQSRGKGSYIPRRGNKGRMKSRRTGSYFSDTTNRCYRDTHLWGRGGNLESSSHGQFLHPPQISDWVEVPSVTEQGGNGSCLDLSVQDFPLPLDSKKPEPSEIHESGQPNLNSPPAKESSPSLESIEFETLDFSPPPLLELPSLEASMHSGSGASISVDAVQGSITVDAVQALPTTEMQKPQEPSTEMQKPQESSKSADEMVPVHPYQLEDDKEFPPLKTEAFPRRKRRGGRPT